MLFLSQIEINTHNYGNKKACNYKGENFSFRAIFPILMSCNCAGTQIFSQHGSPKITQWHQGSEENFSN